MNAKHRRSAIWIFWSFLFSGHDVFARAGGGGGGHGGGGGGHSFGGGGGHSYGGGGGGGMVYVGDDGWIWLIVIAFVILYLVSKSRGTREDSGYVDFPAGDRIRVNNGKPVAQELRSKIETAFFTVQQAWSAQNLSLMRRFISDGVYQRFHAQFTMMKLLGQTNPISNVRIYSIDRTDSPNEDQGPYECIDIRIEASAEDQFISTRHPELNSPGGNERFVEYWSFIRRKDHVAGKNIYSSNLCPKCSAPLDSKMMRDARCNYCGTYVNNGEFDWVLAEITQENDYDPIANFEIPAEVQTIDPTVSIQMLEDKASNAFTQILIATAVGDTTALRRFCTDEIFQRLQKTIGRRKTVYDRLYLNSVVTEKLEAKDGMLQASIHIRYTYHDLDSDSIVDASQMNVYDADLVLVHKNAGAVAKGTIYANACATCGAPQKESLSHVCAYCGAVLNDITREWLVGDIT